MNDTSPGVEEKLRRLWMERSAQERLRSGGDMFATAKRLVRASLCAEGILSEAELRVQMFLRLHGPDLSAIQRERVVATLRRMFASTESSPTHRHAP